MKTLVYSVPEAGWRQWLWIYRPHALVIIPVLAQAWIFGLVGSGAVGFLPAVMATLFLAWQLLRLLQICRGIADDRRRLRDLVDSRRFREQFLGPGSTVHPKREGGHDAR